MALVRERCIANGGAHNFALTLWRQGFSSGSCQLQKSINPSKDGVFDKKMAENARLCWGFIFLNTASLKCFRPDLTICDCLAANSYKSPR